MFSHNTVYTVHCSLGMKGEMLQKIKILAHEVHEEITWFNKLVNTGEYLQETSPYIVEDLEASTFLQNLNKKIYLLEVVYSFSGEMVQMLSDIQAEIAMLLYKRGS